MARLTVEDCIRKLPNRFELALLAARRARYLSLRGEAMEGEKPTVRALREIAEGTVTPENIKEMAPPVLAEESFTPHRSSF